MHVCKLVANVLFCAVFFILFAYAAEYLKNIGISMAVFSSGFLSLFIFIMCLLQRKVRSKDWMITVILLAVPLGVFSITYYINENLLRFFEPSDLHFYFVIAPFLIHMWYVSRKENELT